MMKTLCYSVRLESLVKISDKAFLASAFDGSKSVIPASCIFGKDNEVEKCLAVWVSAWILEKKELQYSSKKQAWFDVRRRMLPSYHIERHVPQRVEPVNDNTINDLRRC